MGSLHNPPSTPCPTHEDLVAFSNGKLPAPACEVVREHLAHCLRCLSNLDSVADAGSSIPDLPQAAVPDDRKVGSEAESSSTPRFPPFLSGSDIAVLPPCILGQYHIVEKIGQGGM